jgi:putative membrane-bound dehydrogenase-like protein
MATPARPKRTQHPFAGARRATLALATVSGLLLPHGQPCAALAAGDASSAALPPDEALKSFAAAPGLVVELVASEPLVESPCAMAFDEKGRLYVVENRGYPRSDTPPQGRIALLEDTDGDGRMDKRTTFAEGLAFPNGVLPWKGGLLVTSSPDFLFLKDNDGDGKSDEQRVLLTGFDTTRSTQLRVNAPTVGPDGWIYLAAGLSPGSIVNPAHPDAPPLMMTGDVRWNPSTGEVEIADGRSQYGQSFDDFGQRFICMNRVQVQHVVLPSAALRRNPRLAFSDAVQNCPELIPNTLMRSTGGAARVYPVSSNITTADSHTGTFSAACAVTIWRGGALPPEYRGCAFSCDPTGNLVHVDKLVPNGASFSAEPLLYKKEVLASRDDWFRPVFLAPGPDGALYVCDMYRRVIEHPDYLPEEVRKHTDFESGKAMGRIWRIRAAKAPKCAPEMDWTHPEERLARSEGWQAQTALRLLAERRDSLRAAPLKKALSQASSTASKAALLNVLNWTRLLSPEDLAQTLSDPSPGVRATAVRLLPTPVPAGVLADKLTALAADPAPGVRFAAALRLGDSAGAAALEALAKLASQNAGDRWTRAAVLSGLADREEAFLSTLLRSGNASTELAPLLEELGPLLARAGSASFEKLHSALSLMAAWPFETRAALAAGFADAFGKAFPAADSGALGSLLQEAVQTTTNSKAAPQTRILGLRVLRWGGWETAGPVALGLLGESKSDELTDSAIRVLARFTQPEVAATLLAKNAWPLYSPARKETILTALLSSGQHSEGILGALESGGVPASAFPALRRAALLKHKDPAIRARASKLFETTSPGKQQALEQAKTALALTPSGAHGRDVFRTLCSTCHRLNQEGHAVGPDLFDIRNQTKENILFHIVAPDAEVAPAFSPYLAETRDGRTLLGILASETPVSVTLRMPLAQEETVLRSNLNTLTAQPGSLMPAGLEAAVSKQDLADLLAYLKGEK